jgi:hypothetical protein
MMNERSFVLGAIAAAGKFCFVNSNGNVYQKFIMQAMLKEAELLFRIKKFLQIGNISINSNNTVYYQIWNKQECLQLTSIIANTLNFLPQYVAWKQAVYFLNNNDLKQAKIFINMMKDISLAQNENALKLRAKINKLSVEVPTSSLLNSIIY